MTNGRKRRHQKRNAQKNGGSMNTGSLLGAMLAAGILYVLRRNVPESVEFPVFYIDDGGPDASAPDAIVARRTDRLLDALARAMDEGDAIAVERIKSVLRELNPPTA